MPLSALPRFMHRARAEAAALIALQPSDRPWQLPFAAAISSGTPMLVGAYLGLPVAGALGAVAGLSFLYLPATSLSRRIPVIMACAFAMLASFAIGLASHLIPGATILMIAGVTAAALLFCRAQAVFPPGPIFMVMAAAIAAFSPASASTAIQNLGYFAIGCVWACAVAVIYSAYILRSRPSLPPQPPSALDLEVALIDAIIVGLFVGASLAFAAGLGLPKPYWVPVSCLAIMQGVTLRASWNRNVHRIIGTVIGMGLTWVLLPFLHNSWALALAVTLLTLLIETAVVRHYAFAAIFITPLTIMLAEASSPGQISAGILMQTRLIDTVIGALIGLAGAACLHNDRVRRLLQGGLAAIRPHKKSAGSD